MTQVNFYTVYNWFELSFLLKANFQVIEESRKIILLIDDMKSTEHKKWNETWILWYYSFMLNGSLNQNIQKKNVASIP